MVSLLISCDWVIVEANNLIRLCYKILNNLNYGERKEMFKLLALIKARSPCYTAADYILLNRNTLFAILSTATTYFILLVQFNQ